MQVRLCEKAIADQEAGSIASKPCHHTFTDIVNTNTHTHNLIHTQYSTQTNRLYIKRAVPVTFMFAFTSESCIVCTLRECSYLYYGRVLILHVCILETHLTKALLCSW